MLEGKIVDASRAPVAGASVTVKTGYPGPAGAVTSNAAGEFSVPLMPGRYTLHVAAGGFREFSQAIDLGSAAQRRLDIVLEVEPHNETVTVTESLNYQVATSSSAKTPTPLLNIPQSISVVTREQIHDQAMQNMADVVRYIPGVTMAQGEGNRDAPVIRGNATTADFYVNGVRDDVQYYRDLYAVERVEAVKGANALTFGRGGGGGVINRVTKEAGFFPIREVSLQGGSYYNRRVTADFDQSFNDKVALRINGMYENSDSFRKYFNLERYGLAPTATIQAGARTSIRLGYEYFHDRRTADRGIPSFAGRPLATHRSTFFGDPGNSYAFAGINLGSATVEHQAGRLNLRNTTLLGDYDKFYQNVLPGSITADGMQVSLSGYNNATQRRNLFNQTDVTGVLQTGAVRHTVLMGTEIGRQRSDNFRNTGYFNGSEGSLYVPVANPALRTPVSFRQGATDADNNVVGHIAAAYLQDQIELSRYFQVVAGIRYDHFQLDFRNNRNSDRLGRTDNLVSPRAGFVFKPVAPLSLYTSYSVSYLPGSGDQFSSLTATTQTLKPEKFSNYEAGAKWDIDRRLSLTAALYRLDRSNTTARDPNNPAKLVQTGSQRTKGYEVGVNGNILRNWSVAGGYAYQNAFVTAATTAAPAGALVALVPHHTFSLWNNYRLRPRWGVGLGLIHQSDSFAGIDNTVTLPSFTRADAATFITLSEQVRLQANVENLFNASYIATAHSNNNIMPGSPCTVRVGLTARF